MPASISPTVEDNEIASGLRATSFILSMVTFFTSRRLNVRLFDERFLILRLGVSCTSVLVPFTYLYSLPVVNCDPFPVFPSTSSAYHSPTVNAPRLCVPVLLVCVISSPFTSANVNPTLLLFAVRGVLIFALAFVKLKSNESKNSSVVSSVVVITVVNVSSTTWAFVPSTPVPVPLSNVRFVSTIS